ncbi:hypothetical protein BDZ89DRAFT_1083814 [Hymenopellis radicata]|nr:hypothetical protein BDZ89DRAFT_1083814 [Hymenopellis radicata]
MPEGAIGASSIPFHALELITDCASLFYTNLVPKTLGTQDRLNLIHSKTLCSLPRMVSCVRYGYNVTKDRESSRTLDDIAKSICKEVSVPFAGMLSLTFDKDAEKEVVAGAVAVVAYTEWMNQVSWALEVGQHFPQVSPLLRHLTEY